MHGFTHGPMTGAIHGPMTGAIHGPITGAIHGPITGAIHGPITGAIHGPIYVGANTLAPACDAAGSLASLQDIIMYDPHHMLNYIIDYQRTSGF